MENFKAVAMPCTTAQWEDIEPELEKYGLKFKSIFDFEKYPFLINNFGNEKNIIGNYRKEGIDNFNRQLIPTYNKQAFLEACGVKFDLTKN